MSHIHGYIIFLYGAEWVQLSNRYNHWCQTISNIFSNIIIFICIFYVKWVAFTTIIQSFHLLKVETTKKFHNPNSCSQNTFVFFNYCSLLLFVSLLAFLQHFGPCTWKTVRYITNFVSLVKISMDSGAYTNSSCHKIN